MFWRHFVAIIKYRFSGLNVKKKIQFIKSPFSPSHYVGMYTLITCTSLETVRDSSPFFGVHTWHLVCIKEVEEFVLIQFV